MNAPLSAAELYGVPLSPDEVDRAVELDRARADAITQETRWLMLRNPHWSLRKAAQWAQVNVIQGYTAKPNYRALVEYARNGETSRKAWEMFGNALVTYYAEQRKRAEAAGTLTFVGD